jgi:predicted Zn-ribbon and HTH transcriptional regulator
MSKLNSFAFDAWLTHDSSLDEVDPPECKQCGALTEMIVDFDEDGECAHFVCPECEAEEAEKAEEAEEHE